jgi:hypothetical protein
MKRGNGIKGRDNTSRGIDILMTDGFTKIDFTKIGFTKINPTDP